MWPIFSAISAEAAVSDDLQFAAALFNDGEYRQALDEFTKIQPQLAGNEWEDDALFWMAECHFYLREYDQALSIYRKLISDYPAFSRTEEAFVKLLGVLYSDGKFERVVEQAELFSKKYPASAQSDQVYLLWIQSALRGRQFTRAEELLDQYQKISPGSPYLWSLRSILANFYLKEQKFDRALPYFEQLYAYQKDANFLLWVGECRFQTSAWAGAREAFSLYLQEQPANEVARFKLGLAEYRLGNFAPSVEALLPLTKADGEYTEDALYFIAQAKLKLGSADDAKKSLSNILRLNPNEELRNRARDLLLSLESEGKDIDRVLAAFEQLGGGASTEEVMQYRVFSAYQKQDFRTVVALLRQPKDRREQMMLAESLYALGSYVEASEAYSKLLIQSASPAEKKAAYAGIAWCAYAQEHHAEAIKAFQTYLTFDPAASADAHLAMAQSALATGQTDQAIAFYDRARKASPEPKKIARNLGILYFNSAEYQRAVDVLEPVADDDQILSIVGRAFLYLRQPNKALVFLRRLKRPERYALEIGAVHYELGQLEEAKTYFEQASNAPGAAEGMNIDEFLGVIAYNQANYSDAASRLRKAQLKDPGNIEIRYELAASLMKMDNAPQQELIEILRSLVSDASTPKPYRDKARMWLARKSTASDAGALEEISKIETPEDRAAALEAKATQLFSQGHYDTAIVFYQKLLALPGLRPETRMQGLYGTGWSLHKLGRKERAQETFRTLLADYPKSSYAAEAVLLLVEESYGAARYAEAADLALKHVNKISKNNARLSFMAAESLYETKRYAEALTQYRAFLPEADNLKDYVRYRAGLASYRIRQFDKSVEFFSAISDTSLLERKYYYLGMVYHDLGKKKQAADEFEKVIQIEKGEFQDEAWKNLVILMESQELWRKAISFGTRLSESPHELDRFLYCKSLSNTASSITARYCEKLGYIAKDPTVASESLLFAALSHQKTDPGKFKQLLEKIIAKFPQTRAAAECKTLLGKLQ